MSEARVYGGMKDTRSKPHPSHDDRDEAVIAADATGMIAGERLITDVEIDEALEGKDPSGHRPARGDHHQ
jgi:hypothetical protein